MTQVPGLVVFIFLYSKNPLFVNHLLTITNGIHDIDPEKPLIVVFANFSNVPLKIPKHILLGYATRSPKLLILVDSTLVNTSRSHYDTSPLTHQIP